MTCKTLRVPSRRKEDLFLCVITRYRLVIIPQNCGSTIDIPVSDGVLAAIVGLSDSEIGANSR